MERRPEVFESVHELIAEYAELEKRLADPAVHADAGAARKLGRRYAELGPVVAAYNALTRGDDAIVAAPELAAEDESFKAEIPELTARREELAEKLRHLLLPRDPNAGKDV